jgi:hypothetical protein
MSEASELYDRDYRAWAKIQSDALSTGRFADLDIAHLLEELNDMGRSERNELENRLVILLAHLLKWQFQYRRLSERWQEFKGDSWRSTIVEQRDRIARRLAKSPGLKPGLPDLIADAYSDAAALAAKETAIPIARLPSVCPYTQDQILDEQYFPEHSD